MRFYNDRGDHPQEIQDLADWKRLAGPVSSTLWKPDRSAQELARAWISGDAQAKAKELLSLHRELGPVNFERATAEKRMRFDDIPRGPRHHDLLVLGRCASGRVVVGVEGKADESFGETLAQYASKKRSPRSRSRKRLDDLTLVFFGTTLARDPSLGPLRYQLCSALAGTLADAHEADAAAAVLLVHEFRTAATDERRHRQNAEALDAFLERLVPEGVGRVAGGEGWIAGPTRVPAGGRWPADGAEVFIAKLVSHPPGPGPGEARAGQ